MDGVCIGKYQNFARRSTDRKIERLGFSLARFLTQEFKSAFTAFAEGLNDLVRPIGRSIGNRNDFQAILRIILRQFIGDGAFDFFFFIERRDDKSNQRVGVTLSNRAVENPRQYENNRWISYINVEYQSQTNPKSYFH